jgi:hypothetical protein
MKIAEWTIERGATPAEDRVWDEWSTSQYRKRGRYLVKFGDFDGNRWSRTYGCAISAARAALDHVRPGAAEMSPAGVLLAMVRYLRRGGIAGRQIVEDVTEGAWAEVRRNGLTMAEEDELRRTVEASAAINGREYRRMIDRHAGGSGVVGDLEVEMGCEAFEDLERRARL